MIDAISKLVESGVIGEETKVSIEGAWNQQVKENRDQVTSELREEFAKRYEHDKGNMVEAIDKMMTEKLSEEISKFVEDRKSLAQEKIAYKEIQVTGSFAQKWSAWKRAIELVRHEKVSLKPINTDIFSLQEWEKAFRKLKDKEGLKIILKP